MSLLEVLISIGIVAVGLLGLASLLPLAGKQATQGLREDRAAAVGRRAFREFMIAGYNNRDAYWVFDGSQGPDDSLVMVTGAAVCIDPLRCAYWIEGNNHQVFGNLYFPPASLLPAVPPGNLRPMNCITLKARPYGDGTNKQSMLWAQAVATCMSHDEFAMLPLSPDHSAAAVPQGISESSGIVKRDDAQDFSWFATFSNASGQQALLSIVVVYKRDLAFATNASSGDQRVAEARYTYNSAVATSGGEVYIFGNTDDQLEVRTGWWVMLVSRPNSTVGQQYRWFRVANASQIFASSTASGLTLYPNNPSGANARYRVLTLQGGDFARSPNTASADDMDKCVLVRGAMSVYEKMVPVEKGSLYNLR